MTDEQLKACFWELCYQVVDPVVELARTHLAVHRTICLAAHGHDSISSHGVVERIYEADC